MSTDPQKRSQGDFAGRLSADSYTSDITVLEQNKGVTEADIDQALSVLNEKDGKIGACMVVLMPELLPNEPNAPGPEFKIRATVQVIVQPLFNDGETGTGKTAEAIARRVRQLLHNFNAGYGTWTFAGMEPIQVEVGKVSYGVAFTRLGRDEDFRKSGTPLIAPDEGDGPQNVTLTCNPDAPIYYTVDGSYPSPLNTAAQIYSAPIAVDGGVELRVVAYFPLRQPSNVAIACYGDSRDFNAAEFSDEFA